MCRISVPDQALLLDSTFTRPATLTSLAQLGPNTAITVDIFNDGPSLSPGATLIITWPLRTMSGSYILYPSSVSVQSDHRHTFPSTHLHTLSPSLHSVSLSLLRSHLFLHSYSTHSFLLIHCRFSVCHDFIVDRRLWSELCHGLHRPREV